MSEWQDIATAPKDGTVLRVKNDAWDWNPPPVVHARFSDDQWERIPMGLLLETPRDIADPTYWQPLPAPPPDVASEAADAALTSR